MTIDKAIEQLQVNLDCVGNIVAPVTREAIKLGIEALKRLTYLRSIKVLYPYKPLPGETKD